ncbi:unnamed protein product [Trifolium pratense]|uniref:Uncharacterized protein n=1 Tax=Trifolium pratense TaxID=57577 RepID=A0ACB0IQ63_TRIPR|nr:unnamed protein product [Trifolium pratense]
MMSCLNICQIEPKKCSFPLVHVFRPISCKTRKLYVDKGCYVGQELVAHTHHRGVIRKRLVPLRFQDNDGKEIINRFIPGSEVVNTGSGKKAGLMTTALGCRGLGLLRLVEALKGSTALSIQGQEDVKVVASKPDWWPSDWLQDLQQYTAFA